MFKLKTLQKQKLKKCVDGTISILLCILLAPFLSISGALVEMSRYQQAKQAIDELMSSSGLSAMADFDSYIEERFGLFAISQESTVNDSFKDMFEANLSMAGGAVTANTVSATGTLPLSEPEVLRQQLMDFSESTVFTETLIEGLKLDKLIEKFEDLTGLDKMNDMTEGAAALSEAVESMIGAGKDFVLTIQLIQSAIAPTATSITETQESMKTLYSAIYTKLDSEDLDPDDPADKDAIVAMIAGDADIQTKITDFRTKAGALKSSMAALFTAIDGIPNAISSFRSALEDAKEALKKTKESAQALGGNSGAAGDKTDDLYEIIIDEMDKACTKAEEDLKTAALDAFKGALVTIRDGLLNQITVPFSADAKNLAIYNILVKVDVRVDERLAIAQVGVPVEIPRSSQVQDAVDDLYFPDTLDTTMLTNILMALRNSVQSSLDEVANNSMSQISGGVGAGLTDLVSAIEGIFKMSVYFDPDFDAYLSASACSQFAPEPLTNPYQKLLDSITSAIQAVGDFQDAIKEWDFLKALKAAADMFKALASALSCLIDQVNVMITKITEVVGYFTSGKPADLYKLLLMCGYMSYNLPNRTCNDGTEYSGVDENGLAYSTSLDGTATTGFDYSNIVVPAKNGTGLSGLDAVLTFISGLAAGGGSQDMFRGAELEYIVAGTQSEIANQVVTFFSLYFMRLLLDLGPVLADVNVANMASAASVAAWAVYLLVIILEPLVDCILLVNGGEIPVIKTSCFLTPAGLPGLVTTLVDLTVSNSDAKGLVKEAFPDADTGSWEYALDYKNYVMLLLLFTTPEAQMLPRLSNLIYLESSAYYKSKGGGVDFQLAKTYTCMNMQVSASFNPFINVFGQSGGGPFQITRTKVRGY